MVQGLRARRAVLLARTVRLTARASVVDARVVSTQGPITVNPAHWLDGDFIPAEPPALRARALRVAQAIEAGGPLARGLSRETLIPCTKHLDGAACPGLMVALKQRDDAILLFCPVCTNDEYLIYEWEDTLWANGPMEPIDISAVAAEHGLGPLGPGRAPTADDRDELLTRALTLVGSCWTPAEVRRSMATANAPSQVIEAIVNSLPIPPPIASLERLLPVLIDLWNDTRGTPAPATPRRKTKVGVNQPCPCGSGKKYKRCCMLHETTH